MRYEEFAKLGASTLATLGWTGWVKDVELHFNHDLAGGDESGGYGLVSAHKAWAQGMTPAAYVKMVRANPHYVPREYKNGTGFPDPPASIPGDH